METGNSRRKRVKADHKLALLALIFEKRDVLFGQFSSSLENRDKQDAWEEVRLKAMSLGICSAARDRAYVRDKIFGEWKSSSIVILVLIPYTVKNCQYI